MKFMVLHRNGQPVYINIDTISRVFEYNDKYTSIVFMDSGEHTFDEEFTAVVDKIRAYTVKS